MSSSIRLKQAVSNAERSAVERVQITAAFECSILFSFLPSILNTSNSEVFLSQLAYPWERMNTQIGVLIYSGTADGDRAFSVVFVLHCCHFGLSIIHSLSNLLIPAWMHNSSCTEYRLDFAAMGGQLGTNCVDRLKQYLRCSKITDEGLGSTTFEK